MAQIDFYANAINLNGSGLGFYGNGFGVSVNVGAYQDTTFITNANGTAQGAQVNNIKYQNVSSGIINSASSGVWLTMIPNYLATLNVRFTHSSAVKTQNTKLYIYDRVNINNDPSGVTQQVAEVIHPDIVQNNNGSGDATWVSTHGSAVICSLAPSPGPSGVWAGNGSNSLASFNWHDWYVNLSASPDSIGSKLYGLYVYTEYL